MCFASSVVFSLVLLGGSPSALPGPAAQQQQEQVRVEENIVVTADREPDDIRNVGSSVSVITAEQIAVSGARWLVDVLQFAPGVSVARSGPAGSVTQVFLRGANASHTLFLIDGVKVSSPATGSYDTAGLQLAADQIERIEIVRGPQSALYGSQAVGGVINVITRRGSGAGTWGVEADGGSYETGRFHTWGSGQVGGTQLIGAVSYFDSSGFSAASERAGNVEADGASNLSFNGRLDYRSERGLVVRGVVRGFDAETRFDGFDFVLGPVDTLRDVQTSREVVAAAALGWNGDRVSTTVEVSRSNADLQTLTPDDFFTAFELESSITEVDWQNEVALPAGQRLIAGVELRREAAFSGSTSAFGDAGFDESVTVVGVYAQDRIHLADRATLTGGLRYEDHSAFGGKWTGRGSATIRITDLLRAHGSAGTGFKAPTLNDLYYPGFSNPDLLPEESVGLDAGIEAYLASPRVRVDATVFHNDVTDLIQYDFVSGRPENLGDVVTSGVELSGEWAPHDKVEVAGAYTFTDAVADGSDEQLIRRPRNAGNLRVTLLPVTAARLWAELRLQGESFDNAVGGREALAGFALVNLSADYRVGRVLLRGRVDNLFDAQYERVSGYGTAGISGYFGATLTLSR